MNNTINLSGGNASITCDTHDLTIRTDTVATCIVTQLPFYLDDFGIGYITAGQSLIIILASIFGGIKDSYRLFYLNQALWDLLISYDYICHSPLHIFYALIDSDSKNPTCFYWSYEIDEKSWRSIIQEAVINLNRYMQFCQIFILAFYRLLVMFWDEWAERFARVRVLLGLNAMFGILIIFPVTFWNIIIIKEGPPGLALLLSGYGWVYSISQGLVYIFYLIIILLTFIFATIIVGKIVFYMKFQLKTKSKNFAATVRFSAVLIFQCFTSFVFFSTIFLKVILAGWFPSVYFLYFNPKNFWQVKLPTWLDTLTGSTPTVLNILRVFVDSTIVLLALTGYRRAMIRFAKLLIAIVRNPKKAMKEMHRNSNTTPVSVLTSN